MHWWVPCCSHTLTNHLPLPPPPAEHPGCGFNALVGGLGCGPADTHTDQQPGRDRQRSAGAGMAGALVRVWAGGKRGLCVRKVSGR